MQRSDPCLILIFGASGDLSKRKLLPALLRLHMKGVVHERTPIVLVSRRALAPAALMKHIREKGRTGDATDAQQREFEKNLYPAQFDYTEGGVGEFVARTREIADSTKCGPNRAIYMALPPSVFGPTADMLHGSGVFGEGGWRRLCFEKPFGEDLASAEALNALVTRHFAEKEIFRIDHYLGKELVRNLLVLRFSNPLFEQIWNRQFIDHVQITVSETVGVEDRAGYYESAGAVRDMVQSHLIQLVALTAMEPPCDLGADQLRDELVKVLHCLPTPRPHDIVLGQYGPGEMEGKSVPGYRQEANVDPNSITETFAALRMEIENFRWKGVPFYLRTGKRMPTRTAEIHVTLREVPLNLFGEHAGTLGPNVITIRIQPNEGIAVRFNVKQPGDEMRVNPVFMSHCHDCVYGLNTPGAYEILMHEWLEGDQTLFPRWDFVQRSWEFTDRLRSAAGGQANGFPNCAAGSEGPEAAEELLRRDGRAWFDMSAAPGAEITPHLVVR